MTKALSTQIMCLALEYFSKIVKFKDTEIPDKTEMHILHLLFFQVPTSYIMNLKKKQGYVPWDDKWLHFLREIEEQCSENR